MTELPEGIFVVKTNSNGDSIWTKLYNGNNIKQTEYQIQKDNGNIIIVGSTLDEDVLVIEIDPMGELLSVNSYGGSGNEVGNGVAITKDGGCVIACFIFRRYIRVETR